MTSLTARETVFLKGVKLHKIYMKGYFNTSELVKYEKFCLKFKDSKLYKRKSIIMAMFYLYGGHRSRSETEMVFISDGQKLLNKLDPSGKYNVCPNDLMYIMGELSIIPVGEIDSNDNYIQYIEYYNVQEDFYNKDNYDEKKIENTIIYLIKNKPRGFSYLSYDAVINLFYLLDRKSLEKSLVPFFKHNYIKSEDGVNLEFRLKEVLVKDTFKTLVFDTRYFSRFNLGLLKEFVLLTEEEINGKIKEDAILSDNEVGKLIKNEDMVSNTESKEYLIGRRVELSSFMKNFEKYMEDGK